MAEADNKTIKKEEEAPKFKGKYLAATGRRKRAIARVRLYKSGQGLIRVNQSKLSEYFPLELQAVLRQPLKLIGRLKDFDLSISIKGGGKCGQAEAARHGIAQVLIEADKEVKEAIRAKGWLTRDARKKERKKPGLKKARRAPQWSKR